MDSRADSRRTVCREDGVVSDIEGEKSRGA